jgi:hypothetical protein
MLRAKKKSLVSRGINSLLRIEKVVSGINITVENRIMKNGTAADETVTGIEL